MRAPGQAPCAPENEIDAFIDDLQVDPFVIYESVDYTSYDARPVFHIMEPLARILLSRTARIHYDITLEKHEVEFMNSVMSLGLLSESISFFQIGKKIQKNINIDKEPHKLMTSIFFLSSISKMHERKVYSFLELIGDLGGVLEILLLIFGIFINPISEFSFYMKAIKKMFLIRTQDRTMTKGPALHKKG